MSGIDYSKWDKLSYNSEEDEDETGNERPRVTRLEYPSRVTLGPNGVHIETTPPLATETPFRKIEKNNNNNNNNKTSVSDSSQLASDSLSIGTVKKQINPINIDHDNEEEDEMMYRNLTRNGGREGESHLWSQTRETASVSFILPTMQIRAKDICNFRLFSEEQSDHTSVYVISFTLLGTNIERRYVLRYPVKVNEEIVEGCWQLHSLPTKSLRLLVVQLVKETVAVGMSLWWDKCFITDQTTIDTAKIADRRDVAAAQAEEFKKTWEKAHEEFRKRVKEQRGRKCVIDDDTSNNNNNDDCE